MCRTMAAQKRILCVLGNRPARRNLFGPVDREQLRLEYQAALRKDLDEASRRWGFDFLSDKPLESGDFQWEDVPGAKVPLLYRPCMLGRGQARGGQRSAEATVASKAGRVEPPPPQPQSDKENVPGTPERCALHLENLENLEKTPERRGSSGLKRKQTNITDFYQAKRRVVGTPRKSGE